MTTVCFFTDYSPDTLIAELAMRCRNIYRVPADPTVPALSCSSNQPIPIQRRAVHFIEVFPHDGQSRAGKRPWLPGLTGVDTRIWTLLNALIYKQPSPGLIRSWAVVLSGSVPFEDCWSPTEVHTCSHPLFPATSSQVPPSPLPSNLWEDKPVSHL